MNHCFKILFSTLAPDLQEHPLVSTCSSARTVQSIGSQLTRDCIIYYINYYKLICIKMPISFQKIPLFGRQDQHRTSSKINIVSIYSNLENKSLILSANRMYIEVALVALSCDQYFSTSTHEVEYAAQLLHFQRVIRMHPSQ